MTCAACSTAFEPSRPWSRYCSARCRRKGWDASRPNRPSKRVPTRSGASAATSTTAGPSGLPASRPEALAPADAAAFVEAFAPGHHRRAARAVLAIVQTMAAPAAVVR